MKFGSSVILDHDRQRAFVPEVDRAEVQSLQRDVVAQLQRVTVEYAECGDRRRVGHLDLECAVGRQPREVACRQSERALGGEAVRADMPHTSDSDAVDEQTHLAEVGAAGGQVRIDTTAGVGTCVVIDLR